MEINWFTFVAQIVNFLILVFVLQRVLYRPIIRAMAIAQVLQTQLQLPQPLNLQFATNPHLICGIELRASGCKLAWSLDNYLDQLEESLSRVFEEEVYGV